MIKIEDNTIIVGGVPLKDVPFEIFKTALRKMSEIPGSLLGLTHNTYSTAQRIEIFEMMIRRRATPRPLSKAIGSGVRDFSDPRYRGLSFQEPYMSFGILGTLSHTKTFRGKDQTYMCAASLNEQKRVLMCLYIQKLAFHKDQELKDFESVMNEFLDATDTYEPKYSSGAGLVFADAGSGSSSGNKKARASKRFELERR